jgi:uncharacterized protein YdaU (DUF1376 family)
MKLNGLMWWIDRWRKSSAYTSMSLVAQAGYRNLLDEAWLRGGKLPNDQHVLARACGDARQWSKIGPIVMRWFHLGADGFLHNDTLDEVLVQSKKRAQKRAQNGARMRAQRVHKPVHNGGDLGSRKDLAN